jgi:hypothetical protein
MKLEEKLLHWVRNNNKKMNITMPLRGIRINFRGKQPMEKPRKRWLGQVKGEQQQWFGNVKRMARPLGGHLY